MLADCWLVGGLVLFCWKIETKNWLTCLDQLTDCMAGRSSLCSAGRRLVNWFWQWGWQNVAVCWLVGGLVFFYFKIETKMTDLSWLTASLAARLFALLVGGWLIGFGKETDRMLTVGWWVAWCFLTSKSRLKWLTCLDWLHGWRLPSMLSWSVVGWLVLAKRLTECWLTVGWLDVLCFYTSKSRLKWLNWLVLIDCMAGGSPLCLAGRWLVDWFWQRDWQNVLADCWLVGGLVFFIAKLRLRTDWLVLISWLTAWLVAPLFA